DAGRISRRQSIDDSGGRAADGMSELPPPPGIREVADVDFARFHEEIRPVREPVIMRGLVSDWPAVAVAKEGDNAIVDYLTRRTPTRPVAAIAAPPEARGR